MLTRRLATLSFFFIIASCGNSGSDSIDPGPSNVSVNLEVSDFGSISGQVRPPGINSWSYAVSQQPTLGTVTLDPVTSAFEYIPTSYAVGTDVFEISMTDSQQRSATATVNVVRQAGLSERPDNATCIAPDRPPSNASVQAVQVFSGIGLWDLISIYPQANDTTHWWGLVKQGQIIRFENDDDVATYTTVLDISANVVSEGESGLIGLAFHPDFANNGKVYIYYTGLGAPTVSHLVEYTSADNGLTLDPASARTLFSLDHTTTRHKGGHIEFGSDGYMYISIGDGGPMDQAQDVTNIFGSFLRIDVDNGDPYAIPPDNPFAAGGGAPEIFAWGFRNPWRWSFDPDTGDIWVGDAGRNSWEEVDIVQMGGNYGWPIREGAHCHPPDVTSCQTAGLIDPVFEYPHGTGSTAVIGGFVYRGSLLPEVSGKYVFADIGRLVQVLEGQPDGSYEAVTLVDSGLSDRGIWSLGRDSAGEIYVVKPDGVFRLEPASANPMQSPFPETLSATGCFDAADPTQPVAGVIPYDLNVPFWSNGAEKQRFMAIPDGTTISAGADGNWVFPVGTVLSKLFYFDGAPIETRLLVRHDDGDWAGYAYEWRADGSDADLLSGALSLADRGIEHTIPSRVQCVQCHVAAAGSSLGPEDGQMNLFSTYAGGVTANQVETLRHIGIIDTSFAADASEMDRFADPLDSTNDIVDRAKTYLHANCANCHRPGGPGRGPMDLRYSTPHEDMAMCDEVPEVDDFGDPNMRIVAPGDPSLSSLNIRVGRLDLGAMPPVGKQVVDDDGVALLDDYVTALTTCP